MILTLENIITQQIAADISDKLLPPTAVNESIVESAINRQNNNLPNTVDYQNLLNSTLFVHGINKYPIHNVHIAKALAAT